MQDIENLWTERWATLNPIELPVDLVEPTAPPRPLRVPLAPCRDRDAVAATFAILVARLCGRTDFDLAFREEPCLASDGSAAAVRVLPLPLRISLSAASNVADAHAAVAAALRWLRRHRSFAPDASRANASGTSITGDGSGLPILIAFVERLTAAPITTPGFALLIARNGDCAWDVDANCFSPERLATLQQQFTALLEANVSSAWRSLPLISPLERRLVMQDWASTASVVASTPGPSACVHEMIAEQAQRAPRDVAVTCAETSLSYQQLDQRANQLAQHLQRLGAGPDTLIAVCCTRSVDLVVALLGVLKSGAAYVPIDPTAARERIAFVLRDSQARIVLTDETARRQLPDSTAVTVCVDRDWPEIASRPEVAPSTAVTVAHLAYCVYREGSAGQPLGVLVEHRNATSFFAAMDARLGIAPGVWLAVSSVQLDVSVLELLWTLTRGYTVIIQPDSDAAEPRAAALSNAHLPVDFSLFYFSADESQSCADRYRLLMEGARFGDAHGFAAVWTPERHFHTFGGLYANPAVTGAAVAAITNRIAVRAGSCVLPLHHPIRVAEEWAMVDNISGGRVGVSFAAGWQPNDFVLNPSTYARAKEETVTLMDAVRRLWRGERMTFAGPRGEVSLQTLPRPVQAELPTWFTTAGDPESYELAGRLGVNVLTHLLGQSVQQLGEKIALYRKTWRAHGHQGGGTVSLMLHTFVGDSDAEVKEIVRKPMKAYLRSSVSLIKGFAEAFPPFKPKVNGTQSQLDFDALTDGEMEALLDYSFERYYQSSGLFGTEDRCAAMVNELKGIGVDDIACLIDFGVETELVLRHLQQLNGLRERTARVAPPAANVSVAALILRHRVTHLQCTPALAQTLVASASGREALRGLRGLCVGGEALVPALATKLQGAVSGAVYTMYGPAEATAWSAMHTLNGEGPRIPLGVPLANNELYVLDAFQQPVPPGTAGELFIGGAQVVRGYWRQPNLTAERFVPNPFGNDRRGRLYRTGDVVRWRNDGKLELVSHASPQR